MGTFDGNNSLLHYERRERVEDEDGSCVPGESKERLDNRVPPGDYDLMQEEVNKWGEDGEESTTACSTSIMCPGFSSSAH
jgi:hypothetical protein